MSGYFLTHDFSPQTINLIVCVCVFLSEDEFNTFKFLKKPKTNKPEPMHPTG